MEKKREKKKRDEKRLGVEPRSQDENVARDVEGFVDVVKEEKKKKRKEKKRKKRKKEKKKKRKDSRKSGDDVSNFLETISTSPSLFSFSLSAFLHRIFFLSLPDLDSTLTHTHTGLLSRFVSFLSEF